MLINPRIESGNVGDEKQLRDYHLISTVIKICWEMSAWHVACLGRGSEMREQFSRNDFLGLGQRNENFQSKKLSFLSAQSVHLLIFER